MVSVLDASQTRVMVMTKITQNELIFWTDPQLINIYLQVHIVLKK